MNEHNKHMKKCLKKYIKQKKMNTFNKTKKQQLKRKKEIMQIIRKKNQNKNAEINDLKINN